MRTFAILAGLIVATIAVMLGVETLAPGMLVDTIFLVGPLAGAGFTLVLARTIPQWSNRRAALAGAAILPLPLWLIAFAIDVIAVAHHNLFEPEKEGFMAGLSIVLFGPCLFGFLFGLLGAAAVTMLRKRRDPR